MNLSVLNILQLKTPYDTACQKLALLVLEQHKPDKVSVALAPGLPLHLANEALLQRLEVGVILPYYAVTQTWEREHRSLADFVLWYAASIDTISKKGGHAVDEKQRQYLDIQCNYRMVSQKNDVSVYVGHPKKPVKDRGKELINYFATLQALHKELYTVHAQNQAFVSKAN
jgi:hypothetical protein